MSNEAKPKSMLTRRGFVGVGALGLSTAVGAGTVMEQFSTTLDTNLGTTSETLSSQSTDSEPLYESFMPSEDLLNSDGTGNSHAIIQKAIDLNRTQAAEGSVLMKNETDNGYGLPLAEGSNVTLFGIRSEVPMLGSSFGLKLYGPAITLTQALTEDRTDFANTITTNVNRQTLAVAPTMSSWSGDEFDFDGAGLNINPTMSDAYAKLNETLNHANCEMTVTGYDPKEPSVSDIEGVAADFRSSFADYGDAAIVVISRPTAESVDYLPGDVAEGLGVDEPLQITDNERAAIELAKECSKNVIVLLNTANAVEIRDLKDDPDISAILWIGFPGCYGMLGVADVLVGKANPSGALTDTYATHNLSAPAMQNMGDYSYANADILTRPAGIFGDVASKYVMECEGIYIGYKYYETRYFDAVMNQGNATSAAGATVGEVWTYSDEVVYPFGYGLSYTTFQQEFDGEPTLEVKKDDKTGATTAYLTVKVKVTNTGDVAGKRVVEVFGQAPYTTGGIEKAAIQLLNFEKTGELAPGASETVEVKCDLQYIASWDSSYANADGTKGTYVLDPGDYYFALGNGAHEAVNNVLAAQGADEAALDGTGDASLAWRLQVTEGVISKTAFSISKNGYQVSNHLEYADWNHFQPGEVTYLSRADWEGTWPKEYADMTLTDEDLIDKLNGHYYDLKTDDDVSGITWGADSDLMFWDMKGKEYDDPAWSELLDKITLEEALYIATFGGPSIPGIDSIGLQEHYLTENAGNGIVLALGASKDTAAPWTISEGDANAAWNGAVFGNAPLTAASFNNELYFQMGEFMGEESLFTGIAMLWGPGLNVHRQQYNGRTGEYYSEDPIVCGNAAMEYSMGALEYGLIASPKHFAFNDQETNRAGVAPYMTEQQARENELRGWQIAFEATDYDTADHNANMTGLMTSFSKIGPVECTCSTGLMTDILKNEWGFRGYAVTDIYDDTDLWASVLVSGTTCFDTRGISGFYKSTTLENCSTFASQTDGIKIGASKVSGDATVQAAVKESAHMILYAMTQSNLVNRYNSTTKMQKQMTWWRGAYLGAAAAFGALAVGAAASAVVSSRKSEKKEA
ncbi:MAG: glycoside hydrolase family 3 C-terminal domain-containing protein [Coriobacteriia bacterium]|nr:glycoside hydrolase family 3 C-terminal domain-containing protein [Coriobacteriia bacterium]